MTEARRYFRRVIKIRAVDSPNVALALAQVERGEEPTNEILVPGIIDYSTYCHHLATWTKPRICVGIEAEFYEGAEVKLFPQEWLDHSIGLWHDLKRSGRPNQARAVGIDPAEGGDDTAAVVVGDLGLIKLLSRPTPDTNDIRDIAIGLIKDWHVDPWRVLFDRGGGGRHQADMLNMMGWEVGTETFGRLAPDPKRGITIFKDRTSQRHDLDTFTSNRCEKYWDLRQWMDPGGEWGGFALPPESEGPQYEELHRQLRVFPFQHDAVGKMILPPKRNKSKEATVQSLEDMLGRSPDHADALVLARRGMTRKRTRATAGAS